MDYYVYSHIHPVTLIPFYIGKGTKNRAYDTVRRNAYWNNIVNKHGFHVSILVDGLTDLQALEIEKQYIKRFELKRAGGCLVNLTYGGKGGKTINEHNIESVREKSRAAKLGSKNPNFGKKTWAFGLKLSEETRKKISIARKGIKIKEECREAILNGLKKAAQVKIDNSYKVKCLITNQVWNNRHHCCESLGIKIVAFRNRIFRNKEIKGNYLQYIKT